MLLTTPQKVVTTFVGSLELITHTITNRSLGPSTVAAVVANPGAGRYIALA